RCAFDRAAVMGPRMVTRAFTDRFAHSSQRNTLVPPPHDAILRAGGEALGLLRTIDEPSALRALPREQLADVARELRDELIELGASACSCACGVHVPLRWVASCAPS